MNVIAAAPLGDPPLVIALVNAMPGAARAATELQFRAILSAASGTRCMQLRCLTLSTTLPMTRPGACAGSISALLEADPPDGLIVTGMPARAASLADEPCWNDLVGLVDLAVRQAIPTVWSCLAAHAAVLHLDGIERRRLPGKLVGLTACTQVEPGHPLMAGLPPRWHVPHSRYNEVPEAALLVAGYRILSRSAEAGADLFAKQAGAQQAGALFLFCQGHPEYDAQALLREYQRDIGQFLAGERDDYPAIPGGVFGPDVAANLGAFAERARDDRRPLLLGEFPTAACVAELHHSWRDVTVGLYANWLAHVAMWKNRRRTSAAYAGSAGDASGG